MNNATTTRTATTSAPWIKRTIAASLLTLAPAFMAVSLSPISAADTGSASSVSAASNSTTKTPGAPRKPIQNGGQKHHHHHRHAGQKHSSDDGE